MDTILKISHLFYLTRHIKIPTFRKKSKVARNKSRGASAQSLRKLSSVPHNKSEITFKTGKTVLLDRNLKKPKMRFLKGLKLNQNFCRTPSQGETPIDRRFHTSF